MAIAQVGKGGAVLRVRASAVIGLCATLTWPCAAEEQSPSGPTFNCAGATSPIGIVICQEPSSWTADWAMSSSYYALLWSLREQDQTRLREGHNEWYKTIAGQCGIGDRGTPSRPRASACVTDQYRSRASIYRKQLSGDAAAEADLPQSTRVAIQKRLILSGLMVGEPDGVFGSGTRQAFRSFKQTRGSQPSDFLTSPERNELLREKPSIALQDSYPFERSPRQYRPRPDQPVDPRQVIPDMLQGMLGGGGPPRQQLNRRQEQADYPRDGYRQPEFESAPQRPYRQGQVRDDVPDTNTPPNLSEFAPVNKSTQSRGQTFATPPEKAAAPPSEFSDSGSSVLTSPLGGPPRPADPTTKTIEVVGSGDTADAARKDAARLAVQQVAGVFIDNQRRIELNMTDNKVSEIVNEKLISYTNAYVSKIDVISTDQKNGLYEVRAKVAVSVAPLLKTLQANDVPTVSFDTATASATAQTVSEEKVSAGDIYLDLLSKSSSLINVGVAPPKVDTSLPSSAEEAWLRIPLTFSVNDEAMREWNAKFKIIAQESASVDIKIGDQPRNRIGSECTFPRLAFDAYQEKTVRDSFLAKRPAGNAYGIAACFSSYRTSHGVSMECYGRSFITNNSPGRQSCSPDQKCYDFDAATAGNQLVIEFIGKENSVVYGTKADIRNFPGLSRDNSSNVPINNQKVFINYCAGPIDLFYVFMNQNYPLHPAYGDTIIFPPRGSKVYAYYNILVPNTVISSIVEVRAKIVRSSRQSGR